MELLELSGLLLLLLGLLLAGGLWLGMSLAFVGFIAVSLVHPPPAPYLARPLWASPGPRPPAALPPALRLGPLPFRPHRPG